MYKDIYDLIIKRSNKGKILSKNDLKYITERLAVEFEIYTDIFYVEVYDDLDDNYSIASIDFDSSAVLINRAKTIDYYKDYSCYYINFIFLLNIVHELTHIEQLFNTYFYKMDDMDTSISKYTYYLDQLFYRIFKLRTNPIIVPTLDEYKMLKEMGLTGQEEVPEKLKSLYQRFHNMLPDEKDANVNSAEFVIDLLEKNIKGNDKEMELLFYYKYLLYEYYLYGYSTDRPEQIPTHDFLDLFGMSFEKTNVDTLTEELNSQYDLNEEEKAQLGLKLSKDEIDYLVNTKNDYEDMYFLFNNKLSKRREKRKNK